MNKQFTFNITLDIESERLPSKKVMGAILSNTFYKGMEIHMPTLKEFLPHLIIRDVKII